MATNETPAMIAGLIIGIKRLKNVADPEIKRKIIGFDTEYQTRDK